MRALCFLFLILFAGAVGLFAYYNQAEVTVRFLEWSRTWSLAHVVALAYGLGMLSGWTVVGMLRRSLNRVAAQPVVLGEQYAVR